jgi:hypothetical protein
MESSMFRWLLGVVVMMVVFGTPPWVRRVALTPALSGRLLVDSVPRRGVLIAVASARDSTCQAPLATARTVARGKFELPAQRAWRPIRAPILGRDYRLSRWRVCAEVGGALKPAFEGIVYWGVRELECAAFTVSASANCAGARGANGYETWRRRTRSR